MVRSAVLGCGGAGNDRVVACNVLGGEIIHTHKMLYLDNE